MSVLRSIRRISLSWPWKFILLRLFGAILILIPIYVYMSTKSFGTHFFSSIIEKQAGDSASNNRSNIDIDTVTPIQNKNSFKKDITDIAQVNDTGPLYLTANFQDRLGNHMFIYASLLGIARAQNRIPFIRSGTHLDNVFQISHVNNNISTKGFRLMKQWLFGIVYPEVWNLSNENITLQGSREVFRYFENIQDEIRREFTFCEPLQRQIDETLGKIRAKFKGHVVVGVHARRGDFLNKNFKDSGFGVPNATYFIKAFNKIRSMLKGQNITFVVASDDLEWCKQNLNFTDVTVMEPGSPALHFGVIANCDHVILSSGTYGWWAAWLANGISIYYDGYFVKGSEFSKAVTLDDYYPPGWIAIGD